MDPGKLDTVLAVIKSANIWDLITALHTEAAADPAVVEMICAKLSEHKSHELAFFLPQLCNKLVHLTESAARPIERLILEMCRQSLHVGLVTYFNLNASLTDNIEAIVERCRNLVELTKVTTIDTTKDKAMTPVVSMYAKLQQEKKRQDMRRSRGASISQPHSANSTSLQAAVIAVPAASDIAETVAPPQGLEIEFTVARYQELKKQFFGAGADPCSYNMGSSLDSFLEQSVPKEEFQYISSITLAMAAEGRVFDAESIQHLLAAADKLQRLRTDPITAVQSVDPAELQEASTGMPRDDVESELMLRRARHDFFFAQLEWINALTGISSLLKHLNCKTKEAKNHALRVSLQQLNLEFPRGVYHMSNGQCYRIIRLPWREAFSLNSREKVPYIMALEVVTGEMELEDDLVEAGPLFVQVEEAELRRAAENAGIPDLTTPRQPPSDSNTSDVSHLNEPSPNGSPMSSNHRVEHAWGANYGSDSDSEVETDVNASDTDEKRISDTPAPVKSPPITVQSPIQPAQAPPNTPLATSLDSEPRVTHLGKLEIIDEWVVVDEEKEEAPSFIDKMFGESWAKRKERVRRSSPCGQQKTWDLLSVIMKSGDDLRQEQLAAQLIRVFDDVFKRNNLPLWLKPYDVVPTSAIGGWVEVVQDTVSLHILKQELGDDPSLRNYFIKAYGDKTPAFTEAQRNFTESLAAYSLICYFLQIKDRHNGNILIDREGHLVHIDYGFMLSSSPGSLGFESAPFKLTLEFVEVMGGRNSNVFDYFKTLFRMGFLKARENAKTICALVDMMLPATNMACFAKGPNTVKELEDRFRLDLSDEEAFSFADELVAQSIGNWRTDTYDYWQKLTVGIVQ